MIGKNKSCVKCKGKFSRKAKEPKFKIGNKIGEFEIIDYRNNGIRNIYICRCSCGSIQEKLSEKLNNKDCCRICERKNHLKNKYIGKVIGNRVIVDVITIGNKNKLKVICNTCNKEHVVFKQELNTRKWCNNCIKGLFPGKIIDGMTLIERLGQSYWNIKCECGVIFKSLLKKYNGRIQSCGCRKRKELFENAKKKIGLKYKYLKIIGLKDFHDGSLWVELKCVCGKKIERPNGNEFKSQSCGCKWHENSSKGENSHWSKLTNFDVLSLRELYQSSLYTTDDLSKMFSITKSYVKEIIKENVWKHI